MSGKPGTSVINALVNQINEITEQNDNNLSDAIHSIIEKYESKEANIELLDVTENGVYAASNGIDGFNPVTVSVTNSQVTSQNKTVTPTTTTQIIEPDNGYDYLSSVTVEGYTLPMNPFAYATNFGAMYNGATVPQNFELDFAQNPNVSFNGFFRSCSGANKITIKNLSSNAISMGTAFRECTAKIIEFVNCTPRPTNSAQCLQGSRIEEIIGDFDMSSENGSGIGLLYSANYLKEIRFVENTIGLTLDMNGTSHLSNDSLISLANGLNSTVQGKELNRFAQKSTVNSILGTVVDGRFIENENGDTTLMDFITTVKGWTVP